MYSFLMDQTYVNLFILISIVVLVMFLWRKLIILEGNFFILEKRVNLIKKDAREDSISRIFLPQMRVRILSAPYQQLQKFTPKILQIILQIILLLMKIWLSIYQPKLLLI